MASCARMYATESINQDSTKVQRQFKLIEGGRPSSKTQTSTQSPLAVPQTRQAPHQAAQNIKRPHPKHAGLTTLLAASCIALAICAAAFVSSRVLDARLSAALTSIPSAEYIVSQGDSLWSIAEHNPIAGHSTHDVVTWIVERNSLEGGLILPGQSLQVPSQVV